jgi:flagellar M-ring protein FliF
MESIFQSLKGFGSVRYVALGIIGAILLTVFSFLSFRLTSPVMSALYSNLSAEDSASLVTELGALGVKFDVQNGGAEILVASPEILKVRMMLAERGLPRRGSLVGYEIFDKENALGTSNFVLNVNLLRALEGELSRTISSLSSIKNARVHLVIPKKDIFQKSNLEPSASVVLTLNNRLDVPKEEAMAVRHLVSSSVPGLKPSKVTIIDSNGKILAKAQTEDEAGSMGSEDTSEYKFSLEERYRNRVTQILEQVVGVGKVDAQVNVDVSFDRVISNSEEFNPDGQVARSTQTTEQITSAKNNEGGKVTVENELAGANANANGSSENNQKTDEVTNFEISKTTTNKVSEIGTVKKVSIAVIVDGKYSTDGSGIETYTARTDEELDQLRALVRSAIGFSADRGDDIQVLNMKFNRDISNLVEKETPLDWLKRDLDSIIKTVVIGIVAILGIMLVIRPLVNKAFDISTADLEAEEIKLMASADQISREQNLASGGGGDDGNGLDVIQSKLDYGPVKKANDIIDNNPEETLNVIRSWLAENK